MNKKVPLSVWEERMLNLNKRRAKESIKNGVPGVDDYAGHIRKCKLGKSVLDVGCGDMKIKSLLPTDVAYYGLDPYPSDESVIDNAIESALVFDDVPKVDTVYMFAALDNVFDFYKAIQHIKELTELNVVFLTGVDIEPDKYHTVGFSEAELTEAMKPFTVGYREQFHPRIILIEFIKP